MDSPSRHSDTGAAIKVLRHATLDVHERLHEAEPFRQIAAGRLERAGYARLLHSILSFHSAVQPILAAAPATAPIAAGGERIRLLEGDLEALGERPSVRHFPWTLESEDEAIGCLYVVQGSAIGGRVIYRQLDYLFENDSRGRTFFAGTEHDAARWKTVRHLLEERASSQDALAAMTAGAQATFSLFESCLADAML